MVEEPDMDESTKEFLRMTVSLMKILCEEAVKSALRYSSANGRGVVDDCDMLRALKYESHVFWDKNIDDRFIQNLEEERRHTYETDEDEESDDEEDDEEEDEEEERVENSGEATTTMSVDDKLFCENVERIESFWNEWQPDDPVKQMLKRAIDSTSERFNM